MSESAITALQAIHTELEAVIESLSSDEWAMPSACEGWRVQDVVAHVTSNLKETVEPSPAPSDPPTELKAEVAMEALVAPRKDWSAEVLMAEYEQYRDGWMAAMAAMQEEPTASTEAPLADLGTHPLHLVANAFAFDHYCHLWHDLLAPSGPIERSLGDPTEAMVRPGIDWMIAGLPQMCPGPLQVVDRPLRLELTGPGGGSWTLHPAGDDGFVSIVEEPAADVAAVATSTAHDFVSWGTKRSDWRRACSLQGDVDYAATVLDVIDVI